MLILLPPSEGKRTAQTGPPLRLDSLAHPSLTPTREKVLAALVATSAQRDAGARLGVPAGAQEHVEANITLKEAPCAPAAQVYAGVLYEALELTSLSGTAWARAEASVLIFSALFGIVGVGDAIPSYRLGATARLDGLGSPRAVWRSALHEIDLADDLVVDLRSGDYASFLRLPGALRVRVFAERDGRRTPVSHWAKQARGHVARALLLADPAPATPATARDAVADYLARTPLSTAAGTPLSYTTELSSGTLDVIVR